MNINGPIKIKLPTGTTGPTNPNPPSPKGIQGASGTTETSKSNITEDSKKTETKKKANVLAKELAEDVSGSEETGGEKGIKLCINVYTQADCATSFKGVLCYSVAKRRLAPVPKDEKPVDNVPSY